MNEYATTVVARFDKRAHKAQILTAEILREIEDIIPSENLKDVHYRLLDLFIKNGTALTTDKEREEFGLEPRDGEGWTPSERIQERIRMDAAMIDIMTRPIFFGDINSRAINEVRLNTEDR